MDDVLKRLYFDPRDPGGYGGVDALYRSAKKEGVTRKDTESWLKNQDPYTLHKPVRKTYRRNKTVVWGKDFQWQADLVDIGNLIKYNDGYRYILTVIDILSKYAWVVPLKQKTGNVLVDAFETIFDQGRIPSKLNTDQGGEFENRKVKALLQKHKIIYFTTRSDKKAAVVERFNRTLKTRMWRYFTQSNTHRYIDVLDDLVHCKK